MIEKISFTMDVTKINKDKITERSYEKEGQQVIVKDYKFDFVPTKEELIKEGDTWNMVKVGFIAESTTKEERDGGYKGSILGNGIVFRDKAVVQENQDFSQPDGQTIDVDSIPF